MTVSQKLSFVQMFFGFLRGFVCGRFWVGVVLILISIKIHEDFDEKRSLAVLPL